MFTRSGMAPIMKTRKQTIEAVHRAMARFPMILEILHKLDRSEAPLPGDDDIRHGCERALTAVMVDLARIPAAPAGKLTKEDRACIEWLHSEQAVRLVNADILQRMHQFIERIVCEDRRNE